MRIGFVVGEFPLLSHTFVISQIEAMMRRGFDVSVICDRIGSDSRIDTSAEPMKTMLANTHRWWPVPPGLGRAVRLLPAKLEDKVSTAADMLWTEELNRCDLLLAHFGGNGLRLARAKKRGRLAPPIVTIFHGNDVGIPAHDGTLDRYLPLFQHGAQREGDALLLHQTADRDQPKRRLAGVSRAVGDVVAIDAHAMHRDSLLRRSGCDQRRTEHLVHRQLLRAVPEVVWALVFVRVLGLGPAAGVLALAITYGGMLGKVYAEILESTDTRPARALLEAGSARLAALGYGLLPNAAQELASYTVYRWECAVRASVVMGFVGAGGLGQLMDQSMKMLDGGEASTILVTFLLLVLLSDAMSAGLRRLLA